MPGEEKPKAPEAPAEGTPKVEEKRTLEGVSAEDLRALYNKSPDLFKDIAPAPKQAEPPKKDEPAKPPEGAAQPEELQVKIPEGLPVDEKAVKEFKAIMSDKKLSDAQKAQAIVDLQAKAYQATVDDGKKRAAQHDATLKADPEFGKDFEASMEVAKRGLTWAEKQNPGLQKRLAESGVANDPAITKHFYEIGKATAEAKTVLPQAKPSKAAEDEESQLRARYPNSPDLFTGNTP